jgi:hypothetical protein
VVTPSSRPIRPPDTDAPAAPSPLTATAGPGYITLDWPDNATDADWASFSVYRSLTAGSGRVLIAEGLTSSELTDYDVNAGTTYYYVATAKDLSDNESVPSNEASATPTQPLPLSLHVNDITVVIANRGKNYFGTATVTVVDQDGNPTSGVEVVGSWSWNSMNLGSGSGVTDGTGVVIMDSPNVKAVSTDVLTFTVTDLVLGGYTYDSVGDVESSDSVTVP